MKFLFMPLGELWKLFLCKSFGLYTLQQYEYWEDRYDVMRVKCVECMEEVAKLARENADLRAVNAEMTVQLKKLVERLDGEIAALKRDHGELVAKQTEGELALLSLRIIRRLLNGQMVSEEMIEKQRKLRLIADKPHEIVWGIEE